MSLQYASDGAGEGGNADNGVSLRVKLSSWEMNGWM